MSYSSQIRPGTKILFANFPGDGHFNPLTGLAKHLKTIGCDVRWYTSKKYEEKISKLGIPFYGLRKAKDLGATTDIDVLFPDRKNHKSQVAKLKYDMIHVFILRGPEYFEDLQEIYEEFEFELMVADITFGAIPFVKEYISSNKDEILFAACEMGYPVAVKVVGPIHKSDIGGVSLNVKSEKHLAVEFDHMMALPGATAVQIQPMLSGKELFIGAKYEPRFGHVVLCGLGGIFVEVLEDFSSGLAPLTYDEAYSMIHSLKSYKIFQGTRGQQGINETLFAEIIVKLSGLLRFATEIKELDFNPLIATPQGITVVDARIRVEKI